MELFKTPDDAILFALRFSSQQYAESGLSRMMKRTGPSSGKGLVALDGSAQAGMIMARIGRMDPAHRACIIARYSSRTEPCACCGQQAPMSEYKGAIEVLADWAMQYLSGSLSVRQVRYAIVQEFFERRRSIRRIADEVKVPARTAYDQKDKLWPHLLELDRQAQEQLGDLLADLCGEVPA